MTLRVAKLALVFAVALYYTLLVFNNITDYDSNYQFVRHVLMMDSTFPGNRGMWRALNQPAWHTVFYLVDHRLGSRDHDALLVGRVATGASAARNAAAFHRAKRVAIVGADAALC